MDIETLMFLKALSAKEPETEEASASGNPATFTTDIVKPLEGLTVTFAPVQEGSGTASPSNIRNISGKSSIKVSVSGGEEYTTSFGDTYYGGTLDVLTGVLTVTRKMTVYDGSEDEPWNAESLYGYPNFYIAVPDGAKDANNLCNAAVFTDSTSIGSFWISSAGNLNIFIGSLISCSTAAEFRAWLAEHNVQLAYLLKTPITVQLTGQQVTDVLGANSISADTNGTVSVTYLKIKSEGD